MPKIDFLVKNQTEKKVFNLFVVLSVKIMFFAYLTLKSRFWPWRWLLIIKTIPDIDYLVKITSNIDIALLAICVCWKSYFLYLWLWNWLFDLEDDLEDDLQSPKNTINGFSSQNHTEKRYHTCSLCYLLLIIFFTYLTLKLRFWPWRWPLIIKIIRVMDH